MITSISRFDVAPRDERTVILGLFEGYLPPVVGKRAGDFEWSVSDRTANFFEDASTITLTLRDRRSAREHSWCVTVSHREMVRGADAMRGAVFEAAIALAWRFYRPGFRIGTRGARR